MNGRPGWAVPVVLARRYGMRWASVKVPKIVFEHPGEATLPTSGFVCDVGGMVVICAGTTGYNITHGFALSLDDAKTAPGITSGER